MQRRLFAISFTFALLTSAGAALAITASQNTAAVSVSAWNPVGNVPAGLSKVSPTVNGPHIDDFIQVALGRECATSDTGVQSSSDCAGALIKWKGPIKYDVYGTNSQESSLIAETLTLLAGQSGLLVERIEHMRDANLKIRFYRPDQRKKFLALTQEVTEEAGLSQSYRVEVAREFAESEQWPCIAFLHSSADGEISGAAVYVHSDLPTESAERCISSTLLQVIGLPNNKSDVSDSLLGLRTDLTKLTEKDKLFVRLLYNEKIRAGMARSDVASALNKTDK